MQEQISGLTYISVVKEAQDKILLEFSKQRQYDDTAVQVMLDQFSSLKSELEQVKTELKKYHPESVSDDEAKVKIMRVLTLMKSSGKTSINIIDIYKETKFPLDQVARIMSILEEEKNLEALDD